MQSSTSADNQQVVDVELAEALRVAESRLQEAQKIVADVKHYRANLIAAGRRADLRVKELLAESNGFKSSWATDFIAERKTVSPTKFRALQDECDLVGHTLEAVAFAILEADWKILESEANAKFTESRVFKVRSAIAQGVEVDSLESIREVLGADFQAQISGSESSKLLAHSDALAEEAGRLRRRASELRAKGN